MNIFDGLKLNSVMDLFDTFKDEQSCVDFLEKAFWKGTPVSPFDKDSVVYKCNRRYKCKNTGRYFTIRSCIDIFKNSNVPLRKWFVAMWLYITHKGGLSSKLLERELGLTQKTTWNMLRKIRKACQFENEHSLSGEVEIDETYVGGKNKNRHANKKVKHSQGRSFKDKTPVLGLIERGGKVVARVVKSVSREELEPIVLGIVNLFDTVYTDEWKAYGGLKDYFIHYIVNHGKREYVRDNAHTNTIENFWSHLKRGIIGVYRVVSRKHLQYYVNEFVFRHNTRHMKEGQLFVHLLSNLK